MWAKLTTLLMMLISCAAFLTTDRFIVPSQKLSSKPRSPSVFHPRANEWTVYYFIQAINDAFSPEEEIESRRWHEAENLMTCYELSLQLSPLIEGPSWLPLHAQVVLLVRQDPQPSWSPPSYTQHRWDFVPLNPTHPATLRQLLLLQPVPAEIRYKIYQGPTAHASSDSVSAGRFPRGITVLRKQWVALPHPDHPPPTTPSLVQRADQFCRWFGHTPDQPDLLPQKDLSLLHCNCWTFAVALYDHLSQVHAPKATGAM